MHLHDVLPVEKLTAAIEERFVVRREHPALPLCILNYTDRCQYEKGAWNDVTRACRGIIYHRDTLEILARPFRKFFNYGQSEAPNLDLSAPAIVTDKMDGSLGVLYPAGGGWAIATRGSFESEQAAHATDILRTHYGAYTPPIGWTPLFEIVYPANRIVLDYGVEDDLYLLGAVEIETGRSIGPHDPQLVNWPGPRAVEYAYRSLADALAAPARANAEGLVVHLTDCDERVKLKQEDYVALHRIVMGLNERVVWEHLAEGRALAELLTPLPDEFHDWTQDVAARLTHEVNALAATINGTFDGIMAGLPEGWTRKDFALRAVTHPSEIRGGLFAKLDGKDFGPTLWKSVYPAGNQGPRQFSEDTA